MRKLVGFFCHVRAGSQHRAADVKIFACIEVISAEVKKLCRVTEHNAVNIPVQGLGAVYSFRLDESIYLVFKLIFISFRSRALR